MLNFLILLSKIINKIIGIYAILSKCDNAIQKKRSGRLSKTFLRQSREILWGVSTAKKSDKEL